jgi:hypothetical protein
MTCSTCGAVGEDDAFCGKCGARISTMSLGQSDFPNYEGQPKSEKGSSVAWTLGILLVVVAVVIGFGVQAANKSTGDAESVARSQDQAIADAQAKQAAADAAQAAAEDAANVPLAGASSVVGAVTSAISTYCPSSNSTQWNEANWIMSSSPTNPPVEGFWELYAPTSGGDYVIVHVTPNAEGTIVTVTAANSYGQQAFEHWGCPGSMEVGVY